MSRDLGVILTQLTIFEFGENSTVGLCPPRRCFKIVGTHNIEHARKMLVAWWGNSPNQKWKSI